MKAAYWVEDVLRSEEEVRNFESVPLADRGLPSSTYQMLMDACDDEPTSVALQYFTDGNRLDETCVDITFAELRARIHQTANLLHSLGVGSADVISVLMPAIPEAQYVLWGGQAAGIINPVNWMLEPDILAHMFQAAGTKVIVAYGDDENVSVWPKLANVAPFVPTLRAVVRVGGKSPCPDEIGGVQVVDYHAVLNRFDSDHLVSRREILQNDIASLFHTGGTTGAPKLARHSHANQVFWVWASRCVSGASEREVRLIGVPIFHVAGAVVGCYAPLARGGRVVMMTSAGYRHPSVLPNLWKFVERFKVTTLSLVPTLIQQLLSIPVNGADLSSITYTASSTAPLSRATAREFREKTGLSVRESYGMTETTAVICLTPMVEGIKVGSCGIRLPYQDVRVVKVDDQSKGLVDCEPQEPGSIVVRGPSTFPGYLEAGATRWLPGGWMDTGDLGYFDDERWIWITGRLKDLIIRGGHNIDPRMVEEAMYTIPDVAEVAVVGAPDGHAGEVPVAYLVMRPGAKLSPEEVLSQAALAVPERAAVPKHCYVLDAMPKTQVGKIQKNLLRIDATERAFQAVLDAAGFEGQHRLHLLDRGPLGLSVEIEVPALNEATRAKVNQALSGIPIDYVLKEISDVEH